MSEDSTRAYGALAGMSYQAPEGGEVTIPQAAPDGAAAQTAGQSVMTPYGASFGPLALSAYPDSTAVVDGLTLHAPSSGWFGGGWGDGGFFASLAGGAAATAPVATTDDEAVDDPRTTRREWLKTAGAATVLAGLTGTAAAASDTVTTASFDLTANPGGLRVQILDIVGGLLPIDQQYYALVDDMDYATFSGGGTDSGDLPPKLTGTTTIDTKVGFLDGVKTTIGRKALSYDVSLDPAPAKVAEGETITVTDHPFIVGAVLKAGASGTTLSLGGTAVPHYEEDAEAAVGYYRVREGDVVYRVGTEPAGASGTMTVYAGLPGEASNDIQQEV